MAQTITLTTIALIFAILGFNERKFLSNVPQYSATITKLFTAVRTSEGVPIGERDKEIAKKATVKLEGLTDKREGDVVLPELFWDPTKSRAGQWDMGHLPEHEYRKLHKDYMDGKIDKDEFLREYRNPDNYAPESVSGNRSHQYEAD